MTRVISGSARGRRLKTVPGTTLRPTADRVKEALFDILGPRIPGAEVLDLCAGTGGLGIEALSRGAAHCTFVEPDRHCCDLLRENLRMCGFEARARVLSFAALDAIRLLARDATHRVAVVLADPPYADTELATAIVATIAATGVLAQGGVLCVERPRAHGLPTEAQPLAVADVRPYGRTALVFYEHESTSSGEGDG